MDKYFISIMILIYFSWIIIFILKFKTIDNRKIYINKEIDDLVEQIYIDVVSFEKCKNFTKALQRNLKHQIDSFVFLSKNNNRLVHEYLNCIKDTVDINDMTLYVGDDEVNMLLRKKARECFYRNITLDVVADLREVHVKSSHLFFIFSDLIDLAIRYIKQSKNNDYKYKILIRASKSNLNNNNFFVIQMAYDIIDNVENINVNQYINEYHKNMMNLLLKYYNGVIISNKKNKRIIETVMIPIIKPKLET